MPGMIQKLKTGLAISRAANQYDKETKMGADPKVSLVKGAQAIGAFLLYAVIYAVGMGLSDGQALEALLAGVGINGAYVGIIVLVARGASVALMNFWKHNNKPIDAANKVGVIVLLALLPSGAFAQSPAAASAQSPAAASGALYCGAMQFASRGEPDHRDFVCRVSLSVPAPEGITAFARVDYTRTQDSPTEGDVLDIQTFRSVEAFAGGRKDVGSGFSVLAFSGVTWDRDANIEPTDPRLWTVAGGARFDVQNRGYIIASVGHHGPVGGLAFLGSAVYEINDGASWFGDVAIPLEASRFAAKPYTVRFGISARLKRWKF